MNPREKFVSDTKGALMVMAAFVAIFLAAIVFQLAGIGGAALEQQTMQDAADAVTFSAATANARGMNMLALINLIMAAALAVLVALRLLVALIAVLVVVLGALCYFSGGATCALIPDAIEAGIEVDEWADEVEDIVKPLTNGLEEAATVINQAVPILAQAEAIYISAQERYDPATGGFVWPIADELPTKIGTFEELCAKAAENVKDAALFLLPLDPPEVVSDVIGDLLKELATGFSDYFCGSSDSKPSSTMEEDAAYPIKDHNQCAKEENQPDSSTGECEPGDAGDGCRKCASWGCAKCLHAQDKSGYKEGKWGYAKDIWVDVKNPDGTIDKFVESSGVEGLVQLDEDPCGGTGSCGYPICADEDREPDPYGYPDGSVRVTRTVYRALHSCVIEEEVEMDVEVEQADGDEWGKPRVLDEEVWPEGARMIGIVAGKTDSEKRQKGVAVAVHGEADITAMPGRLSMASAEYFSPDEDLWHMTWRSRLIRFRFPSSGEDGQGGEGLGDSCSGDFSTECQDVSSELDIAGGLDSLLPGDLSFEDFLVH